MLPSQIELPILPGVITSEVSVTPCPRLNDGGKPRDYHHRIPTVAKTTRRNALEQLASALSLASRAFPSAMVGVRIVFNAMFGFPLVNHLRRVCRLTS